MNLIIRPMTDSLMTKTVSSLLFLKIVGHPLISFYPAKYVNSWLLQKCHSATDTRKERSWNTVLDEKLIKPWNFL